MEHKKKRRRIKKASIKTYPIQEETLTAPDDDGAGVYYSSYGTYLRNKTK